MTANQELIIALRDRYRLPAIYNAVPFTESGGLVAYGGNFAKRWVTWTDFSWRSASRPSGADAYEA